MTAGPKWIAPPMKKPGRGAAEDDERIVDRDVVEIGVEGMDLDVAALVDDIDIGVGGEVAVAVGLAAQALDGVHHVVALDEDGVAELAGPVGVAGHHVEHGREGQQREDAGVPGKVVGGNGGAEGIAMEVAVLVGPLGGVRDFVPVGGCGEGLGEQRIGIERDAIDELVELLGRERRGRWRAGLLGHLLVIRRRGRLAADRAEARSIAAAGREAAAGGRWAPARVRAC